MRDDITNVATRLENPAPSGLHVVRNTDSLEIVRRWLGPTLFRLLFTGFSCDAFMTVWYYVVVAPGKFSLTAFVIIVAAINAGLAYGIAANIFNTTTVTATPKQLLIRQGPLPWPGNLTVAPGHIISMHTRQQISRSKHGTRITYELVAGMKSGGDTVLVDGMANREQALFIEQQVAAFYGTPTFPVPMEPDGF